jgi:membrane protein YqaA with SNARE-associated domain|tara:strand:+ start:1797 stop:2381 length:585 start_codon:yes stop_codon:yes gene_type:complete
MGSKALQEKITSFATNKNAGWYLFAIAFAESTFFPIPPDVLLIPLCILLPTRAFRFALMATLGSVLGGVFGYIMGAMFQQEIGMKIIDFYGMTGNFDMIKAWYQEWDYLIVGTAGFSPIPYKIFTITSGMFNIDFAGFVTVSFLSRGARFFLIAWILWRGGPELKVWIERNLYPLTMFAGIAIILAVVAWQLLK